MSSADPVHLAVITGSVRAGRFGPVVADWLVRRAKQRPGLVVAGIDLAELTVPSSMLADGVTAADAVAVVTPEYNHSFPGPLKSAIDSLREPWLAKPVGLVSYGGISGGLRLVFAELHAMTIRETVSFAFARNAFDANGDPRDTVAVEAAADVFLRQLEWWARALRAARAASPYPL